MTPCLTAAQGRRRPPAAPRAATWGTESTQVQGPRRPSHRARQGSEIKLLTLTPGTRLRATQQSRADPPKGLRNLGVQGVQVEVCSRGDTPEHTQTHPLPGRREAAPQTDRQTDRHLARWGRQGLWFPRSSVRSSLGPALPPRAWCRREGGSGRRGGTWGSPGRHTQLPLPPPSP